MSPMTDVAALVANVSAKQDSPDSEVAPAKLVVESSLADDKRRILEMHRDSFYTACTYVSIILGCYAVAMLVLFAYHVKQKHGRISLYDIYLELAPRRCAEAGATTTSSSDSASSLSTAAAASTTNGAARTVPEPPTAQARTKFYRKKRRARKASKISTTTSCSATAAATAAEAEGDAAAKSATEAISTSADVHAPEEEASRSVHPESLPTLMETAL